MENCYVAVIWGATYDGYPVESSNTEDGETWIDSTDIKQL